MTLTKTQKIATGFLVLAIGTTLSTGAFANPKHAKHAMHMKMADTNQDGSVSLAEFTAQRETRFLKVDTNADNMLSEDERKAHRSEMRTERADKRFAKMDANSDNFISRAEFDESRKTRADAGSKKEKRKMKKMHKHMKKMKHKMHVNPDTNEDGFISRAEFDASTTAMFEMIDTNKDGVLNKEDRKMHKMRKLGDDE
ncbi:MAG: calcium-binding protein [Robiginitomaculum sp.]|nr:MAG: calcium-binding protein [Robiginitomaculum sp.]